MLTIKIHLYKDNNRSDCRVSYYKSNYSHPFKLQGFWSARTSWNLRSPVDLLKLIKIRIKLADLSGSFDLVSTVLPCTMMMWWRETNKDMLLPVKMMITTTKTRTKMTMMMTTIGYAGKYLWKVHDDDDDDIIVKRWWWWRLVMRGSIYGRYRRHLGLGPHWTISLPIRTVMMMMMVYTMIVMMVKMIITTLTKYEWLKMSGTSGSRLPTVAKKN